MLWLMLTLPALAHPGADDHHAEDCHDIPAILRYAEALSADARFPEAHAAIDRAVVCGADPGRAELARGATLLAAGRAAEALPHLDRAVEAGGSLPARLTRADALERVGEHARAAADRLAVLERAPRAGPDLWLGAARALAVAGQREQALDVVRRGVEAVGEVPGLVALKSQLEAR